MTYEDWGFFFGHPETCDQSLEQTGHGVCVRALIIYQSLFSKMTGRLLFSMVVQPSHHLMSEQRYMRDATSYLLGAMCRSLNGSRNLQLTVLVINFIGGFRLLIFSFRLLIGISLYCLFKVYLRFLFLGFMNHLLFFLSLDFNLFLFLLVSRGFNWGTNVVDLAHLICDVN